MNLTMGRRSALALVPGFASLSIMMHHPGVASAISTPAASPIPTNTLQALLDTAVASGLPGVNVGVSIGGGEFITVTAGLASLERETPLALGDTFRLYSITKTFVAIVVLQLIEEGVVSLDDVIPHWLDKPEVSAIPSIDEITVRQLLTHTSGIFDYFDDESPFLLDAFLGESADWSRFWSVEELLGYSDGSRATPYFLPGEGRRYANTNYILLGMIIEKATGKSFSDELDSRILSPLGLRDTRFAGNDHVVSGTVDGYQLLDGDPANVTDTNLSWAWTAGGIVSTIGDLAIFAGAVFSGVLLQPESYDLMFAFDDVTGAIVEGMGLYSFASPFGQIVGMDGESAGFSSCMFHVPEAAVTIVALANVAPGGEVFEALRDLAIAWAAAQAS
ncbi:MAG: serine hydrolase domain-containing protein [Thermomicrobiales bacterium]